MDWLSNVPWAGLAALTVAAIGLIKWLSSGIPVPPNTLKDLQEQIDEEREKRRKLEDAFNDERNTCEERIRVLLNNNAAEKRALIAEYEGKLSALRRLLDDANRRIEKLEQGIA